LPVANHFRETQGGLSGHIGVAQSTLAADKLVRNGEIALKLLAARELVREIVGADRVEGERGQP
jgi:hypothetical protein